MNWITSLFGSKDTTDELSREAQVDAVAVNAQATRLLVKEILDNHRAERRWKLVRRCLYSASIVFGIAISMRLYFPAVISVTVMPRSARALL